MNHFTNDSTLVKKKRDKIILHTSNFSKLLTEKTTGYSLSQNQPKKPTFGNSQEKPTNQTLKCIKTSNHHFLV